MKKTRDKIAGALSLICSGTGPVDCDHSSTKAQQPASHCRTRPWRLRISPWRVRIFVSVCIAITAFALVTGPAPRSGAASGTNITVNFDNEVSQSPASNFGFTATTFGVGGGTVPSNPADQTALSALGAGTVRIHLAPNSAGEIVSGAGGGDPAISGATWLSTYESMGLDPVVILNLDQADALAVLRYIIANKLVVTRYILGNEMDANSKSNVSQDEYISRFRAIAAAMRAITPGLQIGGPAVAWFGGLNQQLIDGLVRAPVAERASFIDYHTYGAGSGESATIDSAFVYAAQLSRLRAMIDDPSVGLLIGEYNMNWSDDPRDNTEFQSVWMADATGTIVSNGASAIQYGDKNSAMGLVANGSASASYWGLGMFTGGGRFRHFGTSVVESSSNRADVHVFASTNSKNIVLVNSGSSTSANVAMMGYSTGTAAVWQDTNMNPTLAATLAVADGSVDVALPAMSVTTLVLDPDVAAVGTHGLAGSYYPTIDFTGTPIQRVDPTVNFDWIGGRPTAGIGPDAFSVRWTGWITPTQTGTYRIGTVSDDGAQLWISGATVAKTWTDHRALTVTTNVHLTAGTRYAIRMDYYENGGLALAKLAWALPGEAFHIVPSSVLAPT